MTNKEEQVLECVRAAVAAAVRETFWSRTKVISYAVYSAALEYPEAGSELISRVAAEEVKQQIKPLAALVRWYQRTF